MYPLDERYTTYCIWIESKPRTIKAPEPKKVQTAMNKVKPYMTDKEVMRELSEFDELGFDDLPSWLKQELRARQLPIPKRFPTELEQWETVSDALEHRIVNKELTIQDYTAKYTKRLSLTLIK